MTKNELIELLQSIDGNPEIYIFDENQKYKNLNEYDIQPKQHNFKVVSQFLKKDSINNIKNYLFCHYKRENSDVVIDEKTLQKKAEKLYRHKDNDFRVVSGAKQKNHDLYEYKDILVLTNGTVKKTN